MTDRNIFIYGETEVSYLKKRDKKLAEVMEKVGPIEREVIPDLFAALVNSIIGQQISTKAHKTIWKKMVTVLGEITPQVIDSLSDEELQQFGITFKKAAYIKSAAQKVLSGELDIESLGRRGLYQTRRTRRYRNLDSRNAYAVFYAASQHIEFRRPRSCAGYANGLSP